MEPLVLTHPPRPGEGGRDRRYTPAWCTQVLIDFLEEHALLPKGRPTIADPCCGTGRILRVFKERGYQYVVGCDIDEGALKELWSETTIHVRLADCRVWVAQTRPKYIITNPPYSVGPQIMASIMGTMPHLCCALLRLNHRGSPSWLDFWRKFPPGGELAIGSKRPSFSGDGKTDASEYAWFIWHPELAPSRFWVV